MRTPKNIGYSKAAIFGGLLTLALPPFYMIPFAFAGFWGLLWLWDQPQAQNPKSCFWLGWWFGMGFFTTAFYWISNALLIDIVQFWWVYPIALLGLPALLSLYVGGMMFFLETHLQVHGGSYQDHPWARPLCLALGWGVMEYIKGTFLSGFPLNAMGYIWMPVFPVLQMTSFFGLWGLTLWTALLIVIPYGIWKTKKFKTPAILSVFIIAPLSYGLWITHLTPQGYAFVPNTHFRIVQPSVNQKDKLNKHMGDDHLDLLVKLSETPSPTPLQFIVWPEVAVPFFLEYDKARRDKALSVIPKEGFLILGGLGRNSPAESPFKVSNSVLVFNNQGHLAARYDKSHLVPFGEYIPMRPLIDLILGLFNIKLSNIAAGSIDFTPGKGPKTYTLGEEIPKLSFTVCYETLFPDKTLPLDSNADVMINVTNDGWYGDSTGPHQNLAATQMRAVEQGIPMVRAANNGTSAIIDPYGRIVKKMAYDKIGVIDSPLPQKRMIPTIYRVLGDLPALIYFIALLLFSFFILHSGTRNSNGSKSIK